MVNNSTNINKNHLSHQHREVIFFDEFLTITQWIEVRCDFCWHWWNCWPSLNELKWEVMFADIGGIVDHHYSTNINKNHLSHQHIEWCQQFLQYIQKSSLTLTQWVMVNNSTNINQNHLSLQLIEWRSTIPQVRGDFVDIGGIVDHHSMNWGERWFFFILVELLTITQW
jgi:hypothetical protein